VAASVLASAALVLASLGAGGAPDEAMLVPVPWTGVKLADKFFRPLQERIRDVTHAHCRKELESARAFELIDRAGRHEGAPDWKRPVWNDSDVWKLVESMAYTLGTDPSPERDAEFDALVARIAAVQMPDGYLDSWFEVYEPKNRWKNLKDCHELYCAGHLIEAAVAHHQATGKTKLLDVALKLAEHIDRRFRTDPDALAGYCGHPEIELALVRLADETRDARWLVLAGAFLDRRGSHYFAREHGTPDAQYEGEYFQDHRPLVQQTKMVGHAVRAGYLWTGATDVAARLGDAPLLAAIDTVWRNTVERRLFVTGGIGAAAANEGFTTDFDLPTATAYQETCASIAFALWNERLGRWKRDGRYHDLFERALLNAILAGYSRDGCHFFYANPLASSGGTTRPEWYDCACCPNNVTRMFAGLGRFVASTAGDELWLHLPIAGTVDATVDGKPVRLEIEGSYPWPGPGRVTVRVAAPTKFTLKMRVPPWASRLRTVAGVKRGDVVSGAKRDGYVSFAAEWSDGDSVSLEFGAEVRRLVADPRAENLRGAVALARGPFVYCVEQADCPVPLDRLVLPVDAVLTARRDEALLGGVDVLEGDALDAGSSEWPGGLYSEAPAPKRFPFRAIPYFAWDERGAAAMRVWLPTAPPPPRLRGVEKSAQIAVSSEGADSSKEAVADGTAPRRSAERGEKLCHFAAHPGGTQWIEYAWPAAQRITSARVFWCDEGAGGQVRAPVSARLLWRDGEQWKPVGGALACAADRWCELEFPALTTSALRLEVVQPDGAACGVHEWNVFGD
jgi:DUF1680 family protein